MLSSVGVVVDGNVIPNRFSFPTASQERYAARLESIPPLKPMTIPSVLDSEIFDFMKFTISSFVFSQSNSGISLMFSPTLSFIQ